MSSAVDSVEHLVRLALAPGIGSVTVHRLLRHFGSAEAALAASEKELAAVAELRQEQVQAVSQARALDPRPELEEAERLEISLIGWNDPAFPAPLRTMYDPPFLLYVKGTLTAADLAAVSVVGTRYPTRYGVEQAERFGGLLARAGFTVVSGLARGIDTAAHRGALAAGGRTLAVLGCGLAHVYPLENVHLAADISRQGALISEFPLHTPPSRGNFPRRNRIVAGLALGVLVVEAPENSGALITARLAVDMGRDVFAVPGRIDQSQSAGCHLLIREGATLVRSLGDILAEIGGKGENDASAAADESFRRPPPASAAEERILAVLSRDAMHFDEICAAADLSAAETAAALLSLELKHLIRQHPGRYFAKI